MSESVDLSDVDVESLMYRVERMSHRMNIASRSLVYMANSEAHEENKVRMLKLSAYLAKELN